MTTPFKINGGAMFAGKLSNKPTEKNVRTSGGILFAESSTERKVHWRGKLSLQTYSKYF
jgi:hypothetical protein